MGVEIKLTDRELPLAPAFVAHLTKHVDGKRLPPADWREGWGLGSVVPEEARQETAGQLKGVLELETGEYWVTRVYQHFVALLTGDIGPINDFRYKYHCLTVLGSPGAGSDYLMQQLSLALGYKPDLMPAFTADDSLPAAGPFSFGKGYNSHVAGLLRFAEFLALVELGFGRATPHDGKILVPKRRLGDFRAWTVFRQVLDTACEPIVLVSHPAHLAQACADQGGGVPADGRFAARGDLEQGIANWARTPETDPTAPEYFEACLAAWERYYLTFAIRAHHLPEGTQIVPGTRHGLEVAAHTLHTRVDAEHSPEPCPLFRDPLPEDWTSRAAPVIRRVAAVWADAGLSFPVDALLDQ